MRPVHAAYIYCRWVERLRVVGLQRQQQPESYTEEGPRDHEEVSTPGNSNHSRNSSLTSPTESESASSWATAPSPSVSYGLGGLTLGGGGSEGGRSGNVTPKGGVKSLPRADGEDERRLQVGGVDQDIPDSDLTKDNCDPAPDASKMDVDDA